MGVQGEAARQAVRLLAVEEIPKHRAAQGRQVHPDLVGAARLQLQAQQREAFVRDSIEKAGAQAAYEAYRLDSIRKVKEMEQNICIYGGPDMMDRRVRRK